MRISCCRTQGWPRSGPHQLEILIQFPQYCEYLHVSLVIIGWGMLRVWWVTNLDSVHGLCCYGQQGRVQTTSDLHVI
jgi:hypothetical protein